MDEQQRRDRTTNKGYTIMKNVFKTPVYHLYHGHETQRFNSRFEVFNRHKSYSKEDWYESIRRNHDWGVPMCNNIKVPDTYINESLLYVYTHSQKPRITICMVNYLRYDILIRSLKNYIALGIPINMLLWVNESKKMPSKVKQEVIRLCSKFSNHDITYSTKNMGTGYPRFMMLNKAYHEYRTDYIMTTDDDIFFPTPESLVLGATILDQEKYKDLGAVSLWCDPIYFKCNIKNNKMIMDKQPSEGFYEVDALGAATMTIHRDVISKCNCDPQYIIGLVDWDLCMTIKKNGWKLGLVCDNKFKPKNDTSGNNDEYKSGRWDKSVIIKSKKLFEGKWNIKIK